MRALFVALAATATAAVVAVALGPRVAGGEAVQAELRRLVQDATGRDLVVRGRIGLDLFPRLRLRLARAAIGDPLAAAGAVRVEADRIDLEVAPLSLLAGELVVRRAIVVRPRVTLAAPAADALVAGALRALSTPGLRDLEAVQLVNGRVDRAAGGGAGDTGPARSLLQEVDGTLRRDALLGRVVVSLAGTAAGAPVELEAEIGEPAGGFGSPGAPTSLAFEVVRGTGDDHAKVGFRGFGAIGGPSPSLEGQFNLDATEPAGVVALASLVGAPRPPARLPWTAPILLDGQVRLADGVLRLGEVEARIGPNELELRAEVGLGPRPRISLEAEGGELVADADSLADLRSVLSLPWWTTRVEGRLAARVALLRWRDRPLRQVRADLSFGPEGIRVERLAAGLPGAAELSLSGSLRPEYDGLRFAGSLSLAAEDARATLAAFEAPARDLLPDRGLEALSLTSELVVAPSGLTLRNFDLRADGARVTGSAALVPGVRPRVALSAAADRLDLGLYLPRPGGVDGARLRERLTAVDAAVEFSAARVALAGLRAEGLRLRGSLEQGLIRLGELSVGEPGEGRLRLSGTADLPVDSLQLAGELGAERPLRLLRALGLEPPPTAARFGPVRLSGAARGGRAGVELELTLAATGLDARLEAALGPWFAPGDGRASVELKAERLDEALRNLGLIAGDEPALARPVRLSARAAPLPAGEGGRHAVALDAEAPPSRVTGALTLGLPPPGAGGVAAVAGRLQSPAVERDLLLALLRIGTERAAGVGLPARPQAWLGRLPNLAVDPGRLRGIDLDLELATDRLLGLDRPAGAGARLRVVPGALSLERLRLPVAGGTLAGVATLNAGPGFGSLGLDLELADAEAGRLLADLGVGPEASGRLRLAARLASTGGTLPELVRGLDGEAELSLTEGSLGGLPPLPGAGGGPARLLALEGGLTVARGIARTAPPGLRLATADAAGSVEAQLDLGAWVAVVDTELRPPGAPEAAEPAAAARFAGSPSRTGAPAPARPAPPPAASADADAGPP